MIGKRRKASFILLLTFGLFASPALASDPNSDFKALDEAINDMMRTFHTPGLAFSVVSPEGIIHLKTFGVKEAGKSEAVTPQTQFAIGSTTKAFTATLLGTLVDEGKVQFDQPIKVHYLPDFQLRDPVASEQATLRDLLSHRTGLPRHDLVWYGSPLSRLEIFSILRMLKPSAGFREKAQYNNLMYMVSGYLAGEVEGSTWEELVQTRLFGPLGMVDSTLSVSDMQLSPDFAKPHAIADDRAQLIPFRNLDSVGPAGSINSSISDMSLWLQLQLRRGQWAGQAILEPQTLADIQTPVTILSPRATYPGTGPLLYGMGWMVQDYRGQRVIFHNGAIDGFSAFIALLPESDRGVVILQNTMSPAIDGLGFGALDYLMTGQFGPWKEQFLPTLETPKLNEVPRASLPRPIEDFLGKYRDPAYGELEISLGEPPENLLVRHHSFSQAYGFAGETRFLPVSASGVLLSDSNGPQIISMRFIESTTDASIMAMELLFPGAGGFVRFSRSE